VVEGLEAESSPTEEVRLVEVAVAVAGVSPDPDPGETDLGIILLPSNALVVIAKLPVILLTASST
jgi:hypothetical protein